MGLTNDMLFVTRKMQNSNDPGHCKKGEQERYFMVVLRCCEFSDFTFSHSFVVHVFWGTTILVGVYISIFRGAIGLGEEFL